MARKEEEGKEWGRGVGAGLGKSRKGQGQGITWTLRWGAWGAAGACTSGPLGLSS